MPFGETHLSQSAGLARARDTLASPCHVLRLQSSECAGVLLAIVA